MKSPFALLVLLVLSPVALSQRTTLVLRDGDAVLGTASLTSVDTVIGIDEDGRWLAWVDTNDPDNATDGALLSGSGVFLREGESLPAPAGASLDSIDGWSADGQGGYFLTGSLDGTTGTADDEALYWNDLLLLREGDSVLSPELSPGTTWKQLFEAWSVGPAQVLVAANVDDPNIPSTTDRALIRVDLNATGQISAQSVVAAEGTLHSTTLPVIADVGVAPQTAAINTTGQVVYQARFAGASAGDDAAVFLDSTLLLREGDNSSFNNRTWEILWNRPVDLNDVGSVALRANLDGEPSDDEVIVLMPSVGGARTVAREGMAYSAFGDRALENFGLNSPLFLAEDDSVLWYADWSDPDEAQDSGLVFTQLDHPNPDFVHRVLIQEGVTRIEGLLVDSIAAEPGGYAMSRDGRYVLCEVRFVGGSDGLVVIDRLGPHPSFCEGDVGSGSPCEPCPCGNEVAPGIVSGCRHSGGVGAELVSLGDARMSSDTLRFEVTGGIPSSFGLLLSGSVRLPSNPSHPCFGLYTGLSSGNLDGLRCIGGSEVYHGVRRSDSAGDIGRTTPGYGPPDRPFAGLSAQGGFVTGQTRHFQVWMRDSNLLSCQTGLASTNGRTVTWTP